MLPKISTLFFIAEKKSTHCTVHFTFSVGVKVRRSRRRVEEGRRTEEEKMSWVLDKVNYRT